MESRPIQAGRATLAVAVTLSCALLAACAGADSGGSGSPPAQPAPAGQQQAAPPRPSQGEAEALPFVRPGAMAEGGLSWTAPEGWQSVPPANPMRKAQYVVPASGPDTETSECVVFYFGPGQGGPPRANAMRWASQFQDDSGAPPEPRIEEDFIGTRKVMKVSVEGTYAPQPMMGGQPHPPRPGFALLGAIVEGADANWFFKCTGPAATIEANREEFEAMIASVRSR